MFGHAVCFLCRWRKSWINIGVRTPRSGMAGWRGGWIFVVPAPATRYAGVPIRAYYIIPRCGIDD